MARGKEIAFELSLDSADINSDPFSMPRKC